MRVKINFAVFQRGEFSEYVESVYEFDDVIAGIRFMAELANNNHFANLTNMYEHVMTREGSFQPPPLKEGLGSGTVILIKDIVPCTEGQSYHFYTGDQEILENLLAHGVVGQAELKGLQRQSFTAPNDKFAIGEVREFMRSTGIPVRVLTKTVDGGVEAIVKNFGN